MTGCQRSGTTLLGLILDSHPDLRLVDEDDGAFHVESGETLLLDFGRVRRAQEESARILAFKAPRDSFRLAELFEALPASRVVWIHRPVEQVVASMCDLHVEAEPWAITHAPREIRKYCRVSPDDRGIREAFSAALAESRQRRRAVALAALCWAVKEKARHLACAASGESIHLLDYTELVEYPETVLRRLCRFLELRWSPDLLKHHELHGGRRIGGTVADEPIHTRSLTRWQERLSEDEVEWLRRAAGVLIMDPSSVTDGRWRA